MKKRQNREKALDFLEEISAPATALHDIMQQVTALEKAEEEVSQLEDRLIKAKEVRDKLAKIDIPGMLLQHGLEELKLSNGKKVMIKENLYVRIPKDIFIRERLFNWMKEQGAESLIKEVLTVEDPKETLFSILNTQGVAYIHEKDVNTNALKAFFREGLGIKKNSVVMFNKEEVPKEFNLYIEKETIIK